ncbi:hypothetical protein [Sporosarcina highlanderae]|uniref:SAF domain-containing protein n=1 Tax=Sporosarcina highlanderae TaxID=3035916 RepID=A0ABT8JLZ5_9BACL|nr:hypothetical protein [Sporosarcina highlanderae]MDN4606176.1 hypothetical protein [Sporosarcina highlanderae]
MTKKIIPAIFGIVILIAIVFSFRSITEVNGLVEGEKSTFVEAKENDKYSIVHFYSDEMTIDDQVKNSSIIVLGEVKEILPSVETNDIVDPIDAAELREKGYNIVHTDIVIKVEKYLGEEKLDFDEIVVRRDGGRINGFVRIVKQEHFNLGEKVLLLRLFQPEQMTQVPEGYQKEQYFMFASDSKFVSKQKGIYYLERNEGIKINENELEKIIDKNS